MFSFLKKKSNHLLGSLLGIFLLFPLLYFWFSGFELSSLGEESVGYRYFYSLRLLYGNDETPWLPQGQFVGLFHQLIQIILTKIGFSPSEILNRVELFSYIASSLPIIFTIFSFIWAVTPFKSKLGQI